MTSTKRSHLVENYVRDGPARDPTGVILKNLGGQGRHWQNDWHKKSIWKRVVWQKYWQPQWISLRAWLIFILHAFFVKNINLLWPFWPLETSNGQGGLNSRKLKIWRFHELYDQKIQMIRIEFPCLDSQNNIWALLNVIGEHTNQRELRKTSCWKNLNTKMGCSLNKSTFVLL